MKVFSTLATALLLSLALAGTGLAQQQPAAQPGEPMEVLRGGPGDDLLIGGEQRELFIGGTGADVIRGEGGSDIIEGGPGNDQLEAESFEETYNLDDGEGGESD